MNASIANGTLASDLGAITGRELEFLKYDWQLWAREDQLAPFCLALGDSPLLGASDSRSASLPEAPESELGPAPSGRLPAGESEAPAWRVWMILGGRGSGKTRAGAEWIRAVACGEDAPRQAAGSSLSLRRATLVPRAGRPARIALVGKTIADVRNVMIEGVSGLLAICPDHERPLFEPSKRRLTWPNGAIAEMFSADERDGLRGPQFTHAWCDELAKWREGEKAWDMLQFALRLGDAPQVVVTTTPRPHAYLKKIMSDAATVTSHLATADNADQLAPAFLAEMTRRYAGSIIGRQELLGEVVEEGYESLWRRAWIDAQRLETAPEMRRVVVALDPPVTATAQSDACGIVVAGLGVDGRAYVLADRTVQGREASAWARAALAAYDDFECDRMVAETNQGGDLVVAVVQQFRENFPVTQVRATRGKWVRAEPVASLYAEGRVVHVGTFGDLEAQMCAFGADGRVGGRSPDRVDALVWAITELMLTPDASPRMRMV